MPHVVSVVRQRTALTDRVLREFDPAGLFVPGQWRVGVGTKVCVDIMLSREGVCLQHGGIVRWRRHSSRTDCPEGIGVQLDPEGLRLVDYLLALAHRSDVPPPQPRARRFLVLSEMECDWRGARLCGYTHDISETGARVSTVETFPKGACVTLRLVDSLGDSIHLLAIVEWSVDGVGMGLRFLDAKARPDPAFRNFHTYLRRCAMRVAAG